MNYDSLQTLLALNHLPGVSTNILLMLYRNTAKTAALKKLSESKLRNFGCQYTVFNKIAKIDWQEIEIETIWGQQPNQTILTIDDGRYPVQLKEISDPPIVLFIKGDIDCLSATQLAIVGSRKATPIGLETSKNFARTLAQKGLVITSGMALGIDGASHRGALEVGKTIAVLGSGLNKIYPHSHVALSKNILKNGALVSEFPLNTPPKAMNFPRRNRIISGLSVGILVVEASLYSGSLITARLAAEQNREVFAIPGSIHSPMSRGCHKLIKEGVKLTETAEDILEELFDFKPQNKRKAGNFVLKNLNSNEHLVLQSIDYSSTSIDEIVCRSNLSASQISTILSLLELKGIIGSVLGGYYRKN